MLPKNRCPSAWTNGIPKPDASSMWCGNSVTQSNRDREKKTQVELKVFLKNRVCSSLNQLKTPSPVSSKILHQLTAVLVLPSGPHNTCAARCQRCQRDMPVPYPEEWHASNPTKFEGSSHKKLRKLSAQPKQIVSISSTDLTHRHWHQHLSTFTCTALALQNCRHVQYSTSETSSTYQCRQNTRWDVKWFPEVENGRSEIWPSAQCLSDSFPVLLSKAKVFANFGWC